MRRLMTPALHGLRARVACRFTLRTRFNRKYPEFNQFGPKTHQTCSKFQTLKCGLTDGLSSASGNILSKLGKLWCRRYVWSIEKSFNDTYRIEINKQNASQANIVDKKTTGYIFDSWTRKFVSRKIMNYFGFFPPHRINQLSKRVKLFIYSLLCIMFQM